MLQCLHRGGPGRQGKGGGGGEVLRGGGRTELRDGRGGTEGRKGRGGGGGKVPRYCIHVHVRIWEKKRRENIII